jgi:hypothetical protein
VRIPTIFIATSAHTRHICFDYDSKCLCQGMPNGLTAVYWSPFSTYSIWLIVYIRLNAHTAIFVSISEAAEGNLQRHPYALTKGLNCTSPKVMTDGSRHCILNNKLNILIDKFFHIFFSDRNLKRARSLKISSYRTPQNKFSSLPKIKFHDNSVVSVTCTNTGCHLF